MSPTSKLSQDFSLRHIGPRASDTEVMLKTLGLKSLAELVDKTVPQSIKKNLSGDGAILPHTEAEILEDLKNLAEQIETRRTFLGLGFVDCITPPVIQRNILENPGWYTQYTPYQAEIAQGRLEALVNFQQMTMDLTGLAVANASLLDEATALAEAMAMSFAVTGAAGTKNKFLVSDRAHPQNIAVLKTRAEPIGVQIEVVDLEKVSETEYVGVFGVAVQYPDTLGEFKNPAEIVARAKSAAALVTFICDPMALILAKSPAEWGADIAVGSFQRFGVPMGFGGPSAAFFATKDEYKRQMPGRIVGVSKDSRGRPAYRLALQTREQHIRREKATSNICTSQVLLAVMASMYAVYHGPKGLREIARRIHSFALRLAEAARAQGWKVSENFFDGVLLTADEAKVAAAMKRFEEAQFNVRKVSATSLFLQMDEKVTEKEFGNLVQCLTGAAGNASSSNLHGAGIAGTAFHRTTEFLTHPVFNTYHSETEMLRYMSRLERKDLSLNFSMIALGSCTMKLNATTEMAAVTWPEFSLPHPATPASQVRGYIEMFTRLESMLARVTGFDAVSLQPNAGSQGEYTGLLVIRAYHRRNGDIGRNVCLIPKSAHGTNPASAAMAGMKVVVVECDRDGNVDLVDLSRKCEEHKKDLAALMITYPSTHGVFEGNIREICDLIHKNGGQVYMDGANMNAQIGLCQPGDFGADVIHLNLHKTFCIPHGGGGPGMGPICVKKHLAPFLPKHPLAELSGAKVGGENAVGAISAAPWGSASILPISYSYMKMMGDAGLRHATEIAILNANYVARKLDSHFPVLYKGVSGLVAHECIIDLRPLKAETGIEVEDVAKRLMDYGFHAPTISFPVPGTIMIEPTESESLAELDRFCDAMISIRAEIEEVRTGSADKAVNVLKNAPHSFETLMASEWTAPYTREKAAFPLPWVRDRKFHVPIGRVDNVYGDRNLVCACPPVSDWA